MRHKPHKPQSRPKLEVKEGGQIQHNAALSAAFNKQRITRMEILDLEGGTLPDGTRYDGPGLIIETEGCGPKSLWVPRHDDLEFFILAHEEHLPTEDPTVKALHACDFLEAECKSHGSDVSRFRGSDSTVYVALSEEAKDRLESAYQSVKGAPAI